MDFDVLPFPVALSREGQQRAQVVICPPSLCRRVLSTGNRDVFSYPVRFSLIRQVSTSAENGAFGEIPVDALELVDPADIAEALRFHMIRMMFIGFCSFSGVVLVDEARIQACENLKHTRFKS
jgi:hypothetical protein